MLKFIHSNAPFNPQRTSIWERKSITIPYGTLLQICGNRVWSGCITFCFDISGDTVRYNVIKYHSSLECQYSSMSCRILCCGHSQNGEIIIVIKCWCVVGTTHAPLNTVTRCLFLDLVLPLLFSITPRAVTWTQHTPLTTETAVVQVVGGQPPTVTYVRPAKIVQMDRHPPLPAALPRIGQPIM